MAVLNLLQSKLQIVHFDTICRSCLCANAEYNICICHYEEENLSTILHKLMLDTPENLGNERMPKNLCEKCVSELIKFYMFVKQYKRSHSLLRGIISSCTFFKQDQVPQDDTVFSVVKDENDDDDDDVKRIEVEHDSIQENCENAEVVDDTIETNELVETVYEDNEHLDQIFTDAAIENDNESTVGLPNLESEPSNNNEQATEDENVSPNNDYDSNLTCSPCGITLDRKEQCLGHQQKIEHKKFRQKYPCEYCGKLFIKCALLEHIKVHTKEKSCAQCDVTFESEEQYLEHQKSIEHKRGRRKYPCEYCGKVFIRYSLREHIRAHTKEKPHECKECSARFTLRNNLLRHMKIHTGERPHVCDFCGKGFIQKSTLITHRNIHTGEKPYMCHVCGKTFANYAQEKIHRLRHAGAHNTNSHHLHLSFKCNFCDEKFPKISLVNKHKLSEHPHLLLTCKICGKKSTSRSAYETHQRIHTGEKPFKCNYCWKNFATSASLSVHVRIHTGSKPHVCNICNMSFRQPQHLVSHTRTHTGEKPFKCQYCGKSFSLTGNLTVHVRIHTGERPYKCEHCSKGFADLNGLKRHRERHKNVGFVKERMNC